MAMQPASEPGQGSAMITFQREPLKALIDDVQPLLGLHYEELTLNKHTVKLAPRWDLYFRLEELESFFTFTARDDRELLGYNAFFLNHHMHYGDLVVAQNDVLFLHPNARRGTTGLRFIDYTEQAARTMGVNKLCYHIKFSHDWRPILHRRGYADEEVMCAKLLT